MITLDNYYLWYDIAKIKFYMIKYLFRRESALKMFDSMKMLRMLKIHNVQHIDVYKRAFHWNKNKWNVYYSLARYNSGIPNQTLNLLDRNDPEWKVNYWKEVVSHDLFIDIDASHHGEIEYAKLTAINLAKRFKENNIPYEVRFSGCGFHVIIPYEYFKDKNLSFNPKDEDNIYSYYTLIAKKLYMEVSDMIDYKLNDSRRLIKAPYSLALYRDYIYVCLPLTDEELFDFKLENMTPEEVIKRI